MLDSSNTDTTCNCKICFCGLNPCCCDELASALALYAEAEDDDADDIVDDESETTQALTAEVEIEPDLLDDPYEEDLFMQKYGAGLSLDDVEATFAERPASWESSRLDR